MDAPKSHSIHFEHPQLATPRYNKNGLLAAFILCFKPLPLVYARMQGYPDNPHLELPR